MNHDETTVGDQAHTPEGRDLGPYTRPEIVDYGTLTELTLGGAAAQTDGLMTAGS